MAQPSIKGKNLGHFQILGMKMDVTMGVAEKWKGRALVIRPKQHRLILLLKLINLVSSWEQSTKVLKIQIPTTSSFIGSHKILNIFSQPLVLSHQNFSANYAQLQCSRTPLFVSAFFSGFCTTGLWNHAAKQSKS